VTISKIRPFFSNYNSNYNYACTAKTNDILQVKNALVKFVFYLTEYTVGNLMQFCQL